MPLKLFTRGLCMKIQVNAYLNIQGAENGYKKNYNLCVVQHLPREWQKPRQTQMILRETPARIF
jgi:hypothetical protein